MQMDGQDNTLNQRQLMRQPRMMPGAQNMPPPPAMASADQGAGQPQSGPMQPGGAAPQMPFQTGQAAAATPLNAPAPGPQPPAVTGQPGQMGGNQNQNAIASSASPTGMVGANLPQTPGFRPRRASMPPPGAAPTGPSPMSNS